MGGELDGVLGQQPNPWGRPGRRRWHRAAGSPKKIKEERKKKCAKGGSSSISCNAIQHPKSFPTQEKDPSSITGCPGRAPSLSKTAPPNQLSPSKPSQVPARHPKSFRARQSLGTFLEESAAVVNVRGWG